MKVKQIIKGWRHYIGYDALPEEMKALASKRSLICFECDYIRVNKAIMRIEKIFRLKSRDGYQCGKCSCSIGAKVLNDASKCPLGKW